jgi:predicted AlkP superfamily phosphohydrolase/phosphomutase
MPARVLVIGIDAAEATLIERWAAEGQLPHLRRLIGASASCRLANSLETLPGAIWPELVTGRSCGKAPLYYHPAQLHTGEARLRPLDRGDVDAGEYYWALASRAGRRVAVVDLPQTVPTPHLNGIQLFEWGLHDRNFAIASDPPELLADIRARYGDHPVVACDLYGGNAQGYDRLLSGLLQGAATKTALLLDLLAREDWDLFACAYGESHCAGHQFWQFLDAAHPRHEPRAPERWRRAIIDVYRRIDEGIGALVAAAGLDTTTFVIASHGMGLKTAGPQLLPEVLVRLGMSSAGPIRAGESLRRFRNSESPLPRLVKAVLKPIARSAPLRHLRSRTGSRPDPLESPQTKAIDLPNNRCGAIRLNLWGREPHGSVQPGAESQALIEELRQELMALKDPASGQRIIDRVMTAAEAFGPDHHPDVPDLLIVFREDMGPLESCYSPRVGLVRQSIVNGRFGRSGDHTTQSRLWATGRRVPAGITLPDANVLDVPATILQALDVPIPNWIDGRPLRLERASPARAAG